MHMSMTPLEMGREVKILDELYRNVMSKGTDYDTIPGTQKPTLLKPGAEILLRVFHLEPVTEIMNRTSIDDVDKPYFDFDVKVTLYSILGVDARVRMGDGIGNANTRETRYAYRWMWGNELPTGFDKQNAVTRKTKAGQIQYRRDSSMDEVYTLKNTVMKMASKRALVDAVLKVTGADRIFTQDVEDMNLTPLEPPEEQEQKTPVAEEKTEPISQLRKYETVRFINNAPRFTGVDSVPYGPFKAEEIANMPKADAERMMAQKYAVSIFAPSEKKEEKTEPVKEQVKGDGILAYMDLKGNDGKNYGTINMEEGIIEAVFSPPIPRQENFNSFLYEKTVVPMIKKAEAEGRKIGFSVDEDKDAKVIFAFKLTGDVTEKQMTDLISPTAWTAKTALEKKA